MAFDKLANSMRLYSEVCSKFDRLKLVDTEEAVNNLDRAVEMKLESLHGLYDVTKNQFEYFKYADTSLLILIRNANHHKDHLLFRSWNAEMFLDDGMSKYSGGAFLLASHNVNEEKFSSQYYYKLDDIYDRIDASRDSPYLEKMMGNNNRKKLIKLLNEQLNFPRIYEQAKIELYPSKQIYINIMPIYFSAMNRVFSFFKNSEMEFKGFDSDIYQSYFTSEHNVQLESIDYKKIRLP